MITLKVPHDADIVITSNEFLELRIRGAVGDVLVDQKTEHARLASEFLRALEKCYGTFTVCDLSERVYGLD